MCCTPSALGPPHESNRSAPDFRRPARSKPQHDGNDASQLSPSVQQQPQRQTAAVKEERKEKEETPRAEEGGDVTKDESSTGSAGDGKEKSQHATGEVATAEVVVAAAAAGGVAADAAAVGANTAKEEEKEEEKEDVLETTSGEDPKKKEHRGSPSRPAGAAGDTADDSAGGRGGAAPPADAGTKIEERADTKPESRVVPGEHRPTAVPQAGGDKGLVEKELPVPAGGGRPEIDSSDEDDGDGFRIVVGREVAPPAAPAAPTKRFLRGGDVSVSATRR